MWLVVQFYFSNHESWREPAEFSSSLRSIGWIRDHLPDESYKTAGGALSLIDHVQKVLLPHPGGGQGGQGLDSSMVRSVMWGMRLVDADDGEDGHEDFDTDDDEEESRHGGLLSGFVLLLTLMMLLLLLLMMMMMMMMRMRLLQ